MMAVRDAESRAQPAVQRPWALAGFAILAAAIPLVLLAPNMLWPHHDGGIFGTIGAGLAMGEMPYRDLWDHKPPGIYVAAALAAALPGAVWPAFWALSVIVLAATGVVLKQIVGVPVALLATACLGLYPAALGGGYTETFGALPAVAAVLLATRNRVLPAGILAGVAVMFSFQYLPMAIAMVVLAKSARYVAGLGTAAASTVALLAAAGVLTDAWDALVTYSGSYLGSSANADPIWHIPLVLAPVATVAVLRGSWRLSEVDRFAVIWLILGVAALAAQGRHLGHHATPLIIPLAILAAEAGRRARLAGMAALVLALIATATIVRYPQSGPATVAVGAWVAARTESGDPILVWGVESNVYLEADRRVAGRYPYLMPLVTPGYSTPQQINAWVAELEADPPVVIVDAEAANRYWAEDADLLRPPPPGAAGGRDLDILDPVRQWIRDHYAFATEIQGRKVYVRVD
jgi:hypothetical protein